MAESFAFQSAQRAVQLLRLLRGTLIAPRGELTPLLEALLEIADSSLTYRYRYLASLQLAPVLDLLLHDFSNPRAAERLRIFSGTFVPLVLYVS